jgi:hypothetical protein
MAKSDQIPRRRASVGRGKVICSGCASLPVAIFNNSGNSARNALKGLIPNHGDSGSQNP